MCIRDSRNGTNDTVIMGGIQQSRLLGMGFGRQIDVKEKAVLMKPLPGPAQKVKERLFVSLLHIFKIHIQPEVSLLQHHLEQLVQHCLLYTSRCV